MGEKARIRVTIADDHPIVRQGLRQMIELDPALSVIAEAGDGEAALEQIGTLRPDIAVLDIDMPRLDGLSIARRLRQRRLPTEIIFLTVHREEELFQAAIDLEVKGYVLKDSAITDIVSSIKAVAAGQSYLSPSLSTYLLNRTRRVMAFASQKTGLQALTPMERRILKLIAAEKTSKEIAEELFISYRTVETHRTNICQKLDLHGNLALVKFALAHKAEL